MAEQLQEQNFRHLVRVASVDLPGNKRIRWALTQIKGVGINFADAICAAAKVQKMTKTGYLSDEQIGRLNAAANNPHQVIPTWMFNHRKENESGEDKHFLTGALTFNQDNDLKLLKKIRCYRGIRHAKGLPVRGQRTRSNFRRSKGKVVGVVKKKAVAAAAKAESGKKEEGKKEAKK